MAIHDSVIYAPTNDARGTGQFADPLSLSLSLFVDISFHTTTISGGRQGVPSAFLSEDEVLELPEEALSLVRQTSKQL